jgi:hypothetical protein
LCELDCLLSHVCAAGDKNGLHALGCRDGFELLEDLQRKLSIDLELN